MKVDLIRLQEKEAPTRVICYAGVEHASGEYGYGGPLYAEQGQVLEQLAPKISECLAHRDLEDLSICFEWMWKQLFPDRPLTLFEKGIDPLTGENQWNTTRERRHTDTGDVVTALSAVDNALWDLRGKLAGKPVVELLGGTRKVLPAYISTHPEEDISNSIKGARYLFDQGNRIQKWFFMWGPVDGEDGFAKNRRLAEGLREELGSEATLMFDFATGQKGRCAWDVDYAIRIAKMLLPLNPLWLEEPFYPEQIKAYRRLKGETGITLACGEHTYSRWNIKPFLDEHLINFVQSDPEWCGGISESLKIADLVTQYDDVVFVPHGHQVPAAAHVVASLPETICPMVEHGAAWLPNTQRAQKHTFGVEHGSLDVPTEPGLGADLDFERFVRID